MNEDHVRNLAKAIGGMAFCALIFWCWLMGGISPIEGKVAFDPYIDTWFAPGYRPELEERIHIGQTKEAVIAILGEPLSAGQPHRSNEGVMMYSYTNDGGYDRRRNIDPRDRAGKDFAWHSFGVCFDSTGLVIGVADGWSYD